jgi:hypothetical protein
MPEKDIRSELEELKAQLASLSRSGQEEEQGAAEAGQSEEGGGIPGGGWIKDILKQAEELWSGLDLQLNDVPAKTALVIFALGVLMGRFLSKRD